MSLRSSQESTTPDVPMLHKMLIIGGPLAEARPWLEQSMREGINERALPSPSTANPLFHAWQSFDHAGCSLRGNGSFSGTCAGIFVKSKK